MNSTIDISTNRKRRLVNNRLECVHFPRCAGCVFETHLDNFPLVLEAQEYFCAHGVQNSPVHYFGAHNWRTRAKLAVRGSVLNPEIGLFEKNSHQVLPIPRCRVHHPAINKAVESVRAWMVECGVAPYHEKSNNGTLRYIQCSVERATGKVQLVLVCNQPLPQDLAQKLWDDSSFWHSLWINENQRTDNVIFTDKWSLVFGEDWLWENLAGTDCCFHPAGFAQANLTAFEALLNRVGDFISPQKRVVEYYAGTGVIGLSLASKGCTVSCFELSAACESAFNLSKQRLKAGQISWRCSSTENALGQIHDFDVIIVDPPRKGLEQSVLSALADVKQGTQLVYISCGWESCKRNLDFLTRSGWKILQVDIYIFFPGSNHIETLIFLEKI